MTRADALFASTEHSDHSLYHRGQGAADEYKSVMQGMVANFGTYSVDEANKTLTTRQEGSWFPNLVGVDQKRIIASLTADELRYTNPTAATGATAEVVWKRVK